MPIHAMGKRPRPSERARLGPGAVVEFDQHGQPILAVIIEPDKHLWVLLDEQGKTQRLPSARLYAFAGEFLFVGDDKERLRELEKMSHRADDEVGRLSLDQLWKRMTGAREFTAEQAWEKLWPDGGLIRHIAIRRALVRDRIYFKRNAKTFEARSAEEVKTMTEVVRHEEEKRKAWQNLIQACVIRLQEHGAPLPPELERPFPFVGDFVQWGPWRTRRIR